MVVDDVCCLYLYRFVGFRGVSATPTPQISWHKTTCARFRLLCHLLCTKSNKHILTPVYAFLMPKKFTYAVVRASIMGQGLPADEHSHYTKHNYNVSCILCKPQRLHISNRRPRYPQTAPLLGERCDSGDSSKTCQVKRQQFQLQQISSN